jgi:hypothetical protein
MWAFRKMLAQSLGAIPGVRDLVDPIWTKATGQGFAFDYRLSPIQEAGASMERVASDIGKVKDGKETKRATRDVLETAGYVTGLVPGQVAAATQFLVDVGYGTQDPETAADWWRGVTTGKAKPR